MPKKEALQKGRIPVSFNLDVTALRKFRSECILSGERPARVIERLMETYGFGPPNPRKRIKKTIPKKSTAPEKKKGE